MDRKEHMGIASAVFDNRRRGEPLLGCDCVTCFGYCLINQDVALRELSGLREKHGYFIEGEAE